MRLFTLGLAFVLTAPAFAGVVGYFKFDNFPTNHAGFTDDAGQGLRGLLGFPFSAPGRVPGPSGLPGDLAVSFDGKSGLVADDSAAEILNFLTPPLTLECWVRSTNASQIGVFRGFINYGIPGGPPVEGVVRGGYRLGLDPAGNIIFTLFAVVDVPSGVPFPFDGQWHHVAATYSIADGGVRFYLDGVEVAFVAEGNDIKPPGTRHLDIGTQATGIGRFDGDIDRVRISKAALTLEQLDSVAGTVKPVLNDTAVFYNFDEASPPYRGQGLSPAGVAISAADWVISHPPFQSAGGPRPSGGGTAKVLDSPSQALGDLAVGFGVTQFGGAPAVDMAAVWDPNGKLNLDGDWTLEAWVKISPTFDGDRDVIFYYGDPGRGYSLSLNYAADRLTATLQVTTLGIAELPSGLAVVAVDVWQHLAVAHTNGQSITYYINGLAAETRPYTGGTRLAETNKVLYIAAQWDGSLPFTGLIDRIRISNSALTANQLDSDPVNPAGPTTLTTYRFEDVTEDFFAVNGIHAGIDFGTGAWLGFLDQAGLSKAGSPVASSGVFTLPAGQVLKAIRLSSTRSLTWRISDGVNPERNGTFPAINTPVFVVTDWRRAATTVTVELEGFIDDVAYGNPPPAVAPVRVTEIRADRVTGNVTLRWEGGEPQFQVEKSATVTGPFVPASGLLSVREFTDVDALRGASQSFYRVRRL